MNEPPAKNIMPPKNDPIVVPTKTPVVIIPFAAVVAIVTSLFFGSPP